VKNQKNIVAILAAGIGQRMNLPIPKQFANLENGKTLLDICVEKFQYNENIDKILIVVPDAFVEEIKQKFPQHDVISGGKERFLSSFNVVKFLTDKIADEDNLWFHDAARPFVSREIIDNIAKSLQNHEVVSTAIPVTETIYEGNAERSFVEEILNRNRLLTAQTPQAARFSIFKKAFGEFFTAKNDDFLPTDDISIIKKIMPEQKIFIVEGSSENKKITFKEDLI
jgi:2-C-methyl-D-erythritol 4-phosphate cytidylyltransferase